MATAAFLLTGLVAYLLGSIPTGFLIGKARGVDLRTLGSGNIGATNALRHLGRPVGVAVLLADAAKGWVAVALLVPVIYSWFALGAGPQQREWMRIVAALLAVLGHNYTCWLRFKGGKGIATSAGVLLALVPIPLVIVLGIWILVFVCSRYVSLASISGAFALPFAAWLTGQSGALIVMTAAMAAMAIYKHKANIERLLNGTENRFGQRRPVLAETDSTAGSPSARHDEKT